MDRKTIQEDLIRFLKEDSESKKKNNLKTLWI